MMFRQQYLVCFLLAMLTLLLAACGGESTDTQDTFRKYSAQDVLNALTEAGLSVEETHRDMQSVAPNAPATFSERYLFAISGIAPRGGQVLIFPTADTLQAWQSYIDSRLANSSTRRDFIYAYVKDNAILILSPELMPNDAAPYRDAFNAMP